MRKKIVNIEYGITLVFTYDYINTLAVCFNNNAVKGERDKVYDEDKLAEIDREQGRKRLTSGQVEALISISVGSQLEFTDEVTLSRALEGRQEI